MKYYVAYKIYVESPREFAGFAIVDVLDLELCSVFLKNYLNWSLIRKFVNRCVRRCRKRLKNSWNHPFISLK